MMRVGIVGENYHNDSKPIKALLEKRYGRDKVTFIPLLPTVRGGIDQVNKIKRMLESDFELERLNFVLYVRDLDEPISRKDKISEREKWFYELDKTVGGNGIFLLLIFELEALILADINTFNKIYKTKLSFKTHPKHEPNPKETLKQATSKNASKKYEESDAFHIFQQLDFDKVCEKHNGERSFEEFIIHFDEKLA